MNFSKKIIGRFWKNVKESDNCWLWLGYKTARYGQFYMNGRKYMAHRISWELHSSSIPPSLYVCHHCDNGFCVRPDHLFLGTQADNMRDAVRKGHHWSTHFPYLAPKGTRNGCAKLNEKEIQEIRLLKGTKISQQQIGEKFGVSQATISMIITGYSWKHLLKRETYGN